MKHIISRIDQEHVQSSLTGKNGDYPEVSYVLIRNIVVDLMGIIPDAGRNSLRTLSHLPEEIETLGIENIRMGNSRISVRHEGRHTSILEYKQGESMLTWHAAFPGNHAQVVVNGENKACSQRNENGLEVSFCFFEMKPGEKVMISIR